MTQTRLNDAQTEFANTEESYNEVHNNLTIASENLTNALGEEWSCTKNFPDYKNYDRDTINKEIEKLEQEISDINKDHMKIKKQSSDIEKITNIEKDIEKEV